LIYYKEGLSEKHLRDIASMFRLKSGSLDIGYLEHWAEKLGVSNQWKLFQEFHRNRSQH